MHEQIINVGMTKMVICINNILGFGTMSVIYKLFGFSQFLCRKQHKRITMTQLKITFVLFR